MFYNDSPTVEEEETNHAWSVSELLTLTQDLLNELPVVKIVGEISNFSRPASGHWYFSLKDQRASTD